MTLRHSYIHDDIDTHNIDWTESICRQLQVRKALEQKPFEEISLYASSMLEKNDIVEREKIQLNLRCEQLQQELLSIQQTILAGGSNAAKSILSKFTNIANHDRIDLSRQTNITIQHTSLLAEKSQLDKKVRDLQDELAELLKSNTDGIQKTIDLRTEVDEKDRSNSQLASAINKRHAEIKTLIDSLEKLELKYRTLTDEKLALTLGYASLEKRHQKLKLECDSMNNQLLAVKETERLKTQARQSIEPNDIESIHTVKSSAGISDTSTGESFEPLGTDEYRHIESKIPNTVESSFDAHDGESCAIHWYSCCGPNDDFLATGGVDRKVKLWKIAAEEDNNLVASLLGSNASITSIDVEGDTILASSNDMATRVWSLTSYKLIRTLTGHSARVLSAKFLGAPFKVASGSQDRTVKVWDITVGACSRTYFAGSWCSDLIFNSQVISGHFDGKIRFWDLNQRGDDEPITQIALQSKVVSLDISKDKTKILCSLRDDTIKCIDIRKLEVLQTYSDEKFKIASDYSRARFSNDVKMITSGSSDGSVYIWDTNTARVQKILSGGHSSMVLACCWSPNGERMVSMEKGKKVSIWL